MAVLVFALVFVALGLELLFVALSGGPSGARKQMASQSRRTRRIALFNFIVAVLVLGLGIPAAVIATVEGATTSPRRMSAISPLPRSTAASCSAQRCANCHTLKASNAVAQVGPNLDDAAAAREALVLNAIKNGRAQGNGQMAANLVEGEDAEDVAAYVAKAVGQTEQGGIGPFRTVPSVRFVISPRNCRVFRPCYDAARYNR